MAGLVLTGRLSFLEKNSSRTGAVKRSLNTLKISYTDGTVTQSDRSKEGSELEVKTEGQTQVILERMLE
ncbi:hypothetical protein AALO_G00164780 [Alosa alosa]|uniref:Uncharacterized protein n=1 Tax=Alosa alosa TaxID=278164 RepID=A0AAV6GE63_9TELE|nr:hypothetical protein AALO_G00164780 [Alosa alosa]